MGLTESLIKAINKAIAEAPFDKTIPGIVESLEDGVCVVRADGGQYRIKTSSSFSVGEAVRICFPRNAKHNPFIVGESTSSGSVDISGYLPLSGGMMEGNINLGTNRWLEGTTTSGGIFSILGLINPTRFQVGGSYPSLELKGKDERPTYNDSEVALMSDVEMMLVQIDNALGDQISIEVHNQTLANIEEDLSEL